MTDELPGVRIPTGPMSGAGTEPVSGSYFCWLLYLGEALGSDS